MKTISSFDSRELCLDAPVSNVVMGLSLLAAHAEEPAVARRFRILFVTKFPPIIGGVASQQYWRARCLAQLGHRVTVVTDANDAHPQLRAAMTLSDFDWLNLQCRESGGSLRTLFTEPSWVEGTPRAEHYHIPNGSMSFSKLRGLALQVAEQERPDLVVVGYLEPYASVACELQRVFGIPACLGFAGSDITRLARAPELGRCYREDLATAAAVVATWEHLPRLFAMGMRPESYQHAPPPLLPDDVFSPGADTEDTGRGGFALGIYGKVAASKRWGELLLAIANLRKSGVPVSLRGHIGGETTEQLRALVRDHCLEDAVSLSGPIMPWHVPAFVKSCDAICCLETGFELDVHEPIIPYEVAKVGVLPIVSAELASKLRGWELESPHIATVADPRNVACLEETLRAAYQRFQFGDRPAMRKAIQRLLPSSMANSEATARLLDSVQRPIRRPLLRKASQPSDVARLQLRTLFYAFYPATAARLGVEPPNVHDSDVPSTPTTQLSHLQAVGRRLLAKLESESNDPLGEDCLRYELARVTCLALGRVPFPAHGFDLDRFGQRVDAGDEAELYPAPLCRVVLVDSCTNLPDVYGLRRRRSMVLRATEKRRLAMRATSDAEPVPILVPPGGDALLRYANGQRSLRQLSQLADVGLDVLQGAFDVLRRARMLTFFIGRSESPFEAELVSIDGHRDSSREPLLALEEVN